GGGLGVGLINELALERLDNHARTQRLGRDLHALGRAIDHGRHLLQVGLERAVLLAGDLGTDTTEILGLTAGAVGPAGSGLLSGESAFARHGQTFPWSRRCESKSVANPDGVMQI